jgi:hypothetical protein
MTEAGQQTANLFKIKGHSRHAWIDMVAANVRGYYRFREHAGEGCL